MMKNICLMLALLCCGVTLTQAQNLLDNTLYGERYPASASKVKNNARLIADRKAQIARLVPVDLFEISYYQSKSNLDAWVLDPILLELDIDALRGTLNAAPEDIRFSVPVAPGKHFELELTRMEVVSEGFSVQTASGKQTLDGPTGLFYSGIVAGDTESVATLSLFGNRLRLLIGDRADTYVLGQLRDDSGQYILFAESNLLLEEPDWDCHTADTPLPKTTEQKSPIATGEKMAGGGCVKVYVETEFHVYQSLSNDLLSVTDYILGMFAESIVAYRNIDVNMEVSELFVWDVADPYSDEDDEDETGAVLDEFIATRPAFNGDLAHLITSRGIGGGLADGIGSICGAPGGPGPHCVSGSLTATADVSTLPSTSSTFVRVAHEMGHILGARHTQACVWGPGNDAQIDDCGNLWVLNNGRDEDGDCPGDTNMDGCECCAGDLNVDEADEAAAAEGGACFDPMNPVWPSTANGRGTIMSYCHLQPNGRDVLNGFHVEVGQAITALFTTAACLTDEDCGCEEFTDRTVNGAPVPDGVYNANSTITSTGVVTGPAPQVVVFQAGMQITLEPGFEATELFIAQIVDTLCTEGASLSMLVFDHTGMRPAARISGEETSQLGNQINAYPNPVSGELTLALSSGEDGQGSVRITNQLGQTVYTLPATQSWKDGKMQTEVDVSAWAPGMYYVVMQTGQETLVRAVVKE